jgi:hypothetical protein
MARVTNTEVTVWAIRAEEPRAFSSSSGHIQRIIVDVCSVDVWLTFEQAKELSDKLDSVTR